jgi:uncharacterized membrane protein YvbJ
MLWSEQGRDVRPIGQIAPAAVHQDNRQTCTAVVTNTNNNLTVTKNSVNVLCHDRFSQIKYF